MFQKNLFLKTFAKVKSLPKINNCEILLCQRLARNPLTKILWPKGGKSTYDWWVYANFARLRREKVLRASASSSFSIFHSGKPVWFCSNLLEVEWSEGHQHLCTRLYYFLLKKLSDATFLVKEFEKLDVVCAVIAWKPLQQLRSLNRGSKKEENLKFPNTVVVRTKSFP